MYHPREREHFFIRPIRSLLSTGPKRIYWFSCAITLEGYLPRANANLFFDGGGRNGQILNILD